METNPDFLYTFVYKNLFVFIFNKITLSMFFSSTEFDLLCGHNHKCVWFCFQIILAMFVFMVIKNIKLFYHSLKKIHYQIDKILNDIQHFNIKIFDVYVRLITN